MGIHARRIMPKRSLNPIRVQDGEAKVSQSRDELVCREILTSFLMVICKRTDVNENSAGLQKSPYLRQQD